MNRERAVKIVLILVGLLFCAAVYPLILMARQEPALAMMMSLYATLGIFLLIASRNPSAHRSLIAFAAWSSFAHATVMGVQAYLGFIAHRELIGSAVFIAIGVALIALGPQGSDEKSHQRLVRSFAFSVLLRLRPALIHARSKNLAPSTAVSR